jgi:uncharacterized protein (TIGR03118 family)
MKTKTAMILCLALAAAPAMAGAAGQPKHASKFNVVNLVSDQDGVALHTDPDLVNAWGISQQGQGPLWISDNGTGLSSVYDTDTGVKEFSVTIPGGVPTGTVGMAVPKGFVVQEGARSGPSYFMFDSESGLITGWTPAVDSGSAVVAVDNSANGSVYKGLAVDEADGLLFAADFHNNEVQIYNNLFTLIGTFTDTSLPKNFAPFNVAFLNNKVYVTFAKRKKHSDDEVDKKGLGYVDVFDTSGNLLQHLIANGALNAPWGMAIAPDGFGNLDGDLLVGNFGDGRINVYDASTGESHGALKGADGKPITIDGLWGLQATPGSFITFAAGPGDESHGLLGEIQPAQ